MASVPTTAPELITALGERGVTQRDIADKLKVSKNAVSAWKKGSGKPSGYDPTPGHLAQLKQMLRTAERGAAEDPQLAEKMRARLLGAIQAVDAADIPELFDQIMPRLVQSLSGEFLPAPALEKSEAEREEEAAEIAAREAAEEERRLAGESNESEAAG